MQVLLEKVICSHFFQINKLIFINCFVERSRQRKPTDKNDINSFNRGNFKAKQLHVFNRLLNIKWQAALFYVKVLLYKECTVNSTFCKGHRLLDSRQLLRLETHTLFNQLLETKYTIRSEMVILQQVFYLIVNFIHIHYL